jgi:hypothetical protein
LIRWEVPTINRAEQTTPPDIGPDEPAGNSSPRSPGASSGSELKRVVDAAAQRVDEIVDGAERVASTIISEAEAEAEAYVDGLRREVEQSVEAWSADLRGVADLLGQQETRLTELTRSMIAELEEIAAVLGRIPPELDRRQELLPETSPRPRPPASARGEGVDSPVRGSQRRADPEEGAEGAEPPARPPSHGHENAVLRAAQMAVAGSSREEIERALASELAISDPAPIVDELLGPRG